jgi:NOL1/NOP2/fmu family ribosome biogenesis protein
LDSSWPELAEDEERDSIFCYLRDRFGISSKQFDGYLMFKRKQAWILLKETQQIRYASHLRVEKAGLKAFRKVSKYVKPTTRFIQLFGNAATKAKVEISKKQLSRLINGEDLVSEMDVQKGYVILSLRDGNAIGIGFFDEGRIRSQLPKRSRAYFKEE